MTVQGRRIKVPLGYLSATQPAGAPAPLAVWQLDGSGSALTDRTPNGHNLVVDIGSANYAADAFGFGVQGFRFDADKRLIAPNDEAFRIALDRLGAGSAALTFEMVCHITNTSALPRIFSCWGAGESEATNYLYELIPHKTAGWWSDFNERGNGSDISVLFDDGPAIVDEDLGLLYVALTVNVDGTVRRLYIQGLPAGVVDDQLEAQKETTGNTQRLTIGAGDSGNYTRGWIFSARITAGVYEPGHIAATWDQIAQEKWIEASGTDRGEMQDSGRIVTSGGPPDHRRHDGLGTGQLVPGPQTQQNDSTGPFPSGGYQDTNQLAEVIPGAGGPSAHTYADGVKVGERIGAGGPPDQVEPHGRQASFQDFGTVERQDVIGFGLDPSDRRSKGDFFDDVDALLGAVCEFNPHSPTTDGEAHTHLDDELIYRAFVYDTDPARNPGEAWAQPTVDNFSGYATDGTHYTAGVQDVGPVQAPWSAESPSNNRSSRSSFPNRVLVVVSKLEIVLYDLDNYPTTLDVWARFKLGTTSTSTEFHFFGRGSESIQRVAMKNGVLYACTKHTGWENGSLHVFDLKRDGDQEAGHLIRSDNHWKLLVGQDFTDRNTGNPWTTTGVSPSLRLQNEYNYQMAVHQDPSDPLRVWVAMAGEDGFDVIELYDNEPQFDYVDTPTGTANVGDARSVAIDPSGMLWLAQDDKIWRNGLDYQGGVIVNPTLPNAGGDINGQVIKDRYPIATLPDGILVRQIVATQNLVLAATDKGVYAVHKTSLEARLAYSVAGKGGAGVSPSPINGEAIPGDREIVEPSLAIWNAQKSSYLMIAAGKRGGIVVVRLRDDVVVQSREYDHLQEPGAFFTVGYVE